MAINSIVSPESGSCGDILPQYITVGIRNNGSVSQSNIPITLTIGSSAGVLSSQTTFYPGTIPALTTVTFTFQTPVLLSAATAYTITATTNLATDQFASNNQLVTTITTQAKPAAPSAVGGICNTTAILKVNNPSQSNYFWYSTATGSSPFANGVTVSTSTIPTDKTYFVQKEARITVGPVNKLVYPNGGYNNYRGNYIIFNNTVPVIIESAKLYIGNPGTITFETGLLLTDTTYHPENKVTFNVFATNPNPQPSPVDAQGNPLGISGNPASDTGAVFFLNLPIFTTGNHILRITCDPGGATIFRNNGTTPIVTYPVGVPNIFTITSNSATGQESQFYYFFYDMKVNTGDCVSDRVSVVAADIPKPVITRVVDSLVSSVKSTGQWYINDTAISGATGSSIKPVRSGIYKFTVNDASGCSKSSDAFSFILTAIDPVVAARDINLQVSPNPNNGIFNLSFEVSTKADLNIDLFNESGQRMYNSSYPGFSGKFSKQIRVGNLSSAVYMLRIQHNKKTYMQKIIVEQK